MLTQSQQKALVLQAVALAYQPASVAAQALLEELVAFLEMEPEQVKDVSEWAALQMAALGITEDDQTWEIWHLAATAAEAAAEPIPPAPDIGALLSSLWEAKLKALE
jgi:hypothetical protein